METDIARWARELGCEIPSGPEGVEFFFYPQELERFAALVAAAEREKCAKFLELIDLSCIAEHESCQRLMAGLLKNCAESIRTRGQK